MSGSSSRSEWELIKANKNILAHPRAAGTGRSKYSTFNTDSASVKASSSTSSTSSSSLVDEEVAQDTETPRRLSDALATHISNAFTSAIEQQESLDKKLLEALEKVEEYDVIEKDLMSIDFEAIPNHYQHLEAHLSNFDWSLPNLLFGHDVLHSHSLPNFPLTGCLPGIDADCLAAPKLHIRHVKSLNDIEDENLLNSSCVKYKVSHNDKPASPSAPETESKHFQPVNADEDEDETAEKQLKDSISHLVSLDDLVLDRMSKSAQAINSQQTFPVTNSETVKDKSKQHVTAGTQTTTELLSVFEAYVQLKRQLSKPHRSQINVHKLQKELIKYKILKDVSIGKYMGYQSKDFKLSSKNAKSEQIKASRRHKKVYWVDTHNHSKWRNTITAGAIATTPRSSSNILTSSPLKTPGQISKRRKKDNEDQTKIKIIKNPSTILPQPKSCSNIQHLLPWFRSKQKGGAARMLTLQAPAIEYGTGALSLRAGHVCTAAQQSTGRCSAKKDLYLRDILTSAQNNLLGYRHPNITADPLNVSKWWQSDLNVLPTDIYISHHKSVTYHHSQAAAPLKPVILPKIFLQDRYGFIYFILFCSSI